MMETKRKWKRLSPAQNSRRLTAYLINNPNSNAKDIEQGLNWTANKVQRYLTLNASQLKKGYIVTQGNEGFGSGITAKLAYKYLPWTTKELQNKLGVSRSVANYTVSKLLKMELITISENRAISSGGFAPIYIKTNDAR